MRWTRVCGGGGSETVIFGLIDSGTTNTRVRLSDGDRVLAAVTEAVGARDAARDGSNSRLRSALHRLVQEAGLQAGIPVGDIAVLIASGMITSNLGLLEVPHVQAPVRPAELARAIVTKRFPDIAPCDIAFIPGIKTVASDGELVGSDILRGEEAEVVGLRRLMGLAGPVTFLHYGSPHNAVRTDAA
ncbi:MAG: 2-keto-3-deoxy-galactonokinase, partial [Firmicutes bacterium]|nr:2-keto-3-deoxy-galactonokinase [Bacillota bacterium]